ncbi:MAG: glutamate--tRNA ligase [Clostridia bacterium]
MDYDKLAELLFGEITTTIADLEEQYPKRELPENAVVTRFAPSPTGFMHLGNLYGALVDERLARKNGSVFYLRIEDTDLKRSVENGVSDIIDALKSFGINFTEGATATGDIGAYGPYRQRQRINIYKTFAKKMVQLGRAYPCFCTEQDLAEMRSFQEKNKQNFGYYGSFAKHRDMPYDEIEKEIKNNVPYVLRFKSFGDPLKHTVINDPVRGKMEIPENDQDHVLLKSDGVPTYHFAHVCDDYLMRTTHVVRGEEWLSTLPLHIELFDALSLPRPLYIHTSQLMKLDEGAKRKLSKRKDKEAALSFYHKMGYPSNCVIEYLMTILNSNFEQWRSQNLLADINDFEFSPKKMGISGALFDLDKLNDVSKNYISRLSASEVLTLILEWAKSYDIELYNLLNNDTKKAEAILAIGRGGNKPRKDITYFEEVKNYLSFFYDELFKASDEFPENISKEDIENILKQYILIYDINDDQTAWFDKITKIAVDNGFAAKTKEYKQNPDAFKGHVGDVSSVIRVSVTGRQNSPDMFAVMQILGYDTVISRMKGYIK